MYKKKNSGSPSFSFYTQGADQFIYPIKRTAFDSQSTVLTHCPELRIKNPRGRRKRIRKNYGFGLAPANCPYFILSFLLCQYPISYFFSRNYFSLFFSGNFIFGFPNGTFTEGFHRKYGSFYKFRCIPCSERSRHRIWPCFCSLSHNVSLRPRSRSIPRI